MPILVLDIGGVVYRSWPDDAFHARWAARRGCDEATLAQRLWGGDDWRLAELGLTSAEENIERLAARLGVEAELAREMVFEGWASQPDEALAACVAGLRAAGATVAALTNNTSSEAQLLARPELARLFDAEDAEETQSSRRKNKPALRSPRLLRDLRVQTSYAAARPSQIQRRTRLT